MLLNLNSFCTSTLGRVSCFGFVNLNLPFYPDIKYWVELGDSVEVMAKIYRYPCWQSRFSRTAVRGTVQYWLHAVDPCFVWMCDVILYTLREETLLQTGWKQSLGRPCMDLRRMKYREWSVQNSTSWIHNEELIYKMACYVRVVKSRRLQRVVHVMWMWAEEGRTGFW